MKATSKRLSEHSLNMALSAIEIYNKPVFCNREQIFSILMAAAWESLLKAKILRDNDNKLTAIYVLEDKKGKKKKYKPNRFGEPMTIDINAAIERCGLPKIVAENISQIVRIRDAAIHLSCDSKSLPQLVFSLGSASLRNYSRLLQEWFGTSLSDYNFYILPIGFSYPFKTFSLAQLKKEPEIITNIIKEIAAAQDLNQANDGDYFLVCNIETKLISAKKITDVSPDVIASISQDGGAHTIIQKQVNKLDQYPHSWKQIKDKLKKQVPGFKTGDLNKLIVEQNIKNRPEFAEYSYRTKEEESRGPGKATASVYNDDFFRFALQELSKKG